LCGLFVFMGFEIDFPGRSKRLVKKEKRGNQSRKGCRPKGASTPVKPASKLGTWEPEVSGKNKEAGGKRCLGRKHREGNQKKPNLLGPGRKRLPQSRKKIGV